ncbi:tripartite motif-containing protein 2-like [Dysidea avara]|uniref:tripartite motif-containing protein 2-like n=1 Tax=Dysidea avara TaxID=196820 RepID=UPI00331F3DCF
MDSQSIAHQFSPTLLDPQMCETLHLPKDIIAGRKVQYIVITKNGNGHRCYRQGDNVSIQLLVGVAEPINVINNNDGVYMSTMVVDKIGEVELSVLANGEHIKGSPFKLTVRHHYTLLCQPSEIHQEWLHPYFVAFNRSKCWAFSESSVVVRISEGRSKVIDTQKLEDPFHHPAGVSFDEDDNLYIMEQATRNIFKFTIDGDLLLQFSTRRSDDVQLNCPKGFTVHNGKVYIADPGNGRITVLHTDGTFHQIIGKGQMGMPFDVTVNINEELLVTDITHFCIHRFTLDGMYIGKFSSYGKSRDGYPNTPHCITNDSNGYILVTQLGDKNQVVIFDNNGHYVHSFGPHGSGDGEFSNPHGIAVNNNEDIYICDLCNNRIHIFHNE